MSRTGDWIATFTGRKWFITDPDPADVCIQDIAHALSLTCRYGGHCREFYSVAEHCVRMSEAVQVNVGNDEIALWALLHDSAEAYLGDVVRPLKQSLPDYKSLEQRTEEVILIGLGVAFPTKTTWEIVKHYDDVLLMTERRDMINHNGIAWTSRAEPLPGKIVPLSPAVAAARYLRRFLDLTHRV